MYNIDDKILYDGIIKNFFDISNERKTKNMEEQETKMKITPISNLTINELIYIAQENICYLDYFKVVFANDKKQFLQSFSTIGVDRLLQLFNPMTGNLKEGNDFVVFLRGADITELFAILRKYDSLKKRLNECCCNLKKNYDEKFDVDEDDVRLAEALSESCCRCKNKEELGQAFTGKSDTVE